MDDLTLRPADWKLIDSLKQRPHPYLNDDEKVCEGLPIGVQEILMEARVAHHLLDLAGIPRGEGYSADLDARVVLLMRRAMRTPRLAEMHQPDRDCDGRGGNSGFCVECGWAWPCATYETASGERDDEV